MDVLSHRGSWSAQEGNDGSNPVENTIPAFSRALAEGADGFECDVHRTADDRLVIHHDADAPDLGVLATLTLAEIRARRPDIPTLAETLDACRGLRCNVEIKNMPTDADFDPTNRVVALVADELAARGHDDNVIVSSFNLATVDAFRERCPEVDVGWLIGAGMAPLTALAVVRDHGLDALHPGVGSLPRSIAEELVAAAAGIALNVWTVNDPETARMFAELGYTSVITDDVPGIRAAMR